MSKNKIVSYTFKNPTKLTKILIFLLYTYLIASFAMTISSLFEYNLLLSISQGITVSDEVGEASDFRQGILGLIWSVAMLSTMIFYCFWLYRAINNARSFNISDFTLAPNWTVACYFVPVICFYGPYQHMQKLWKACKNLPHWKNEKSSSLIKWWWFFWISKNILFTVSSKMEEKATTINAVINALIVEISGHIGEAICALLLILIIKEIFKMQQGVRYSLDPDPVLHLS